MRATWSILSLLLVFLIEVNSEPQNEAVIANREPTENDYSVYDLLGNTKPRVPSILNFKTWSEETIKYHRKLIVLIYYSRNKCLQCAQRERVLEEVIERFHPQVDFWRYNCDEEFDRGQSQDDLATTGRYKVDSCHKNYPDRLPTVSFLVPDTNVYYPYDPNSFQQPLYEPDFSDPNSLADMIASYMPVYAKRIKNIDDANNFIEKFGHLSKALYFVNSEEIPIYFKGLTAVFKDKLEFGIVSPDAYEVVEFFNITSRPRWVVVKIKNLVFMEKRQYKGRLTFSDVSNYLSLFASKNETDRTQMTDIGSNRVRDTVLKNGSKIHVDEINYENFRSNLNYPEDIIILHVTDTFSMNYPNLHTFQVFYGNITRYQEAIGNNLNKKRVIKKVLPNEHKPYIIVYPRGNVTYKLKHQKVLGANHTIEHLLEAVSSMLPDAISPVENDLLETKIIQSLFDRKLTLVLFHDEEEVSLGLRRLALSPYYRKYFDFYQMKNPPKDRLKQLGIKKLSKLVLFMADPVLLAEPDSMPPIDKISFEMGFIFDNLKSFLDDMIAEHGKYLQDVPQISAEEDLGPLLLDTRKRYFLLFIVDKEREEKNEQWVDRMNDMLVINKAGGKKVASAYIDFRCFPYLAEVFRFQEKNVPLMVVYDSKESAFIRSDSKLNIYDGRDLIEKAVHSDEYRPRFRKVKFQLGPNKCQTSEEKIDL